MRAPGPGKYEVKSQFGVKSGAGRWSMAGKPRSRREDETPGPDKYSHPRTSFGGTKHSMAARFHYRDKEDTPSDAVPKDGKAVVPPVVRSYIGQGPKFSMGGRTHSVRSDLTPDPTKYNPLAALKFTSLKVPAFSMGAKPRTIARDPYQPSDPAASGVKDGKAVIAPSVKTLIGSGGPKYSMSGRTHHPRGETVPGPGNYPGANLNLLGKNNGPSYSMSARVRGGIQYGHWGDEPRLTERLPPLNN
jgi:hypothetical protein